MKSIVGCVDECRRSSDDAMSACVAGESGDGNFFWRGRVYASSEIDAGRLKPGVDAGKVDQ
jgi:hypothetical protein